MPGKSALAAMVADMAGPRFNEAPARMPGKSTAVPTPVGVIIYASMRPRHECRGRGFSHDRASRFHSGFNEAPARMPGKSCASARRSRPTYISFNEAPARMPGKRRLSSALRSA